MKKFLLPLVLTLAFITPAFCAFAINDSNNDGEELAQTSKQRIMYNNKLNGEHHSKTAVIQEVDNEDKDLQTNVMGMHRKHQNANIQSQDISYLRSEKPTHHQIGHAKVKKNNSEDDNPNLANLTTPEVNVRNNLAMSDQDATLNRQMMLNGPQGGIQNNQPPGIGGTSANY
ncbi:hypothetical protein CDV26_04740 [Francisella halioticida]|uniref:Cell surface protein n=1 Tax=Francisella halioticida TaxID=549298 RepID=A0ABN5AYE6_9GAMM|nr:hypothetical protein [Francisella halioticida]ASG67787.1 hypothetical protein CDV26_04740 [Francisella halioticida]